MPFNISKDDSSYVVFENSLIENILSLAENGCYSFYSGMAMGFDIIAAEAVLLLRKATHLPLKLICVVPFKNQKDTFNAEWQAKYNFILENCDEIITLYDDYFKGCYQRRNQYMVDNSDCVLTWFDGKSGGTKNTLDYACKKGRFIINLNKEQYKDFSQQLKIELML